MAERSTSQPPHIVLCPFMSKGHTIPLLHLTKLIHKHRPEASFTIFTTPANEPFIFSSLSLSIPTSIFTIISLSFVAPDDIRQGVESTDQLPSMSLFHSFALALEQLQPHFEAELKKIHMHQPVTCVVSDGFLYWTQPPTTKLNIPWLMFYGMNVYAGVLTRVMFLNKSFDGIENEEELVQVPDFHWIRIAQSDLDEPFRGQQYQHGPAMDFLMKCGISSSMSYGCLINCFEELEKPFVDYSNSMFQPKNFSVGPFCLAEKPKFERSEKSIWLEWLDKKRVEGKSVLYVAFGSQAEISNNQLKEIATGLEKSEVDFLWALRIKPNQEEVLHGFEEKVKGRGLVVKEWVEQRVILEHECVQGFLSHCGWNSAIESICAGVPIIAWPMMAEQPLNARMVVEEIKVGLRVETCDGSVRGFVKWEGLSKVVKELMQGEIRKDLKMNVKHFSDLANKAVEEGGSSWSNLESLLSELEKVQNKTSLQNGKGNYENGSTMVNTVDS